MHPFAQANLSPRPWNAWLHSFAFLRMSCAAVDGSLRCAVEEFACERTSTAEDEDALLNSLSAAAGEWGPATVFTLGGSRTAIPALRWRCLARDVVIAPLQRPFLPFRASLLEGHAACIDLIDDLEFRYARPPPGPAAFCDAIGLRFTEAFEVWRHDPGAIAGILAVAAGVCLALRLMHDGSTSRSDAALFVEALRAEIDDAAREAPWLESLICDFRIRRDQG